MHIFHLHPLGQDAHWPLRQAAPPCRINTNPAPLIGVDLRSPSIAAQCSPPRMHTGAALPAFAIVPPPPSTSAFGFALPAAAASAAPGGLAGLQAGTSTPTFGGWGAPAAATAAAAAGAATVPAGAAFGALTATVTTGASFGAAAGALASPARQLQSAFGSFGLAGSGPGAIVTSAEATTTAPATGFGLFGSGAGAGTISSATVPAPAWGSGSAAFPAPGALPSGGLFGSGAAAFPASTAVTFPTSGLFGTVQPAFGTAFGASSAPPAAPPAFGAAFGAPPASTPGFSVASSAAPAPAGGFGMFAPPPAAFRVPVETGGYKYYGELGSDDNADINNLAGCDGDCRSMLCVLCSALIAGSVPPLPRRRMLSLLQRTSSPLTSSRALAPAFCSGPGSMAQDSTEVRH